MIIGAGFALFGMAVKYLPIFPKEEFAKEATRSRHVADDSAVLEHAGD